jgi:hypothetical protein
MTGGISGPSSGHPPVKSARAKIKAKQPKDQPSKLSAKARAMLDRLYKARRDFELGLRATP